MEAIIFRKATVEDAPLISLIMMEAVGMDAMSGTAPIPSEVVEMCKRNDTLYTYEHALLCCVDGKPIGGIISYSGSQYKTRRKCTFQLIRHLLTFDIEQMQDETQDGEYYLDSLAILPAYRNRGLGRQLIERSVQYAEQMGLIPVLACAPQNDRAHRLYSSIGFREDGHLFIFGEDYLRMTKR